ncbi:MAG: hypothetical protein M5U26_03095 [Planctomycetota bacterium]|nr:hypothetical protein [Planctomycetota bacterium]
MACLVGASLPWAAFGAGDADLLADSGAIPVRGPQAGESELRNLVDDLKEIDARRLKVNALVARLDVTLRDKAKNKDYQLNGAYLGDKDGNLRLRIKHDETLLLDMAFHDGKCELWLPRKKKFYSGQVEELRKASGNQLALLANAGTAHDLFFPRPWTENALERRVKIEDGKQAVSVIEMPGIYKRRVRRYLISSEPAKADEVEIFDLSSNYLGTIRFQNYELPAPGAEGAADQPMDVPYPRRVVLASSDNRNELQLDVKDKELIKIDALPMDKLQVPAPQGVQVLDLGEALKSGQSLFD